MGDINSKDYHDYVIKDGQLILTYGLNDKILVIVI